MKIRNRSIINNLISSFSQTNPTHKKLSSLHFSTKRFINNNPEIIITRADKGNITVAIDKKTYEQKMLELLEDKDTYIIVKKDPTNKLINNVHDLLSR